MVSKIFLTGGSGFLGGRLVRSLSSHGYETHAFKGDIRDITAIKRELEQEEFTAIIHAAGVGSVSACRDHPQEALDINVGGTVNLAEAVRAIHPTTPILFLSSGQVYAPLPKGETRGFRETDPTLISGNLYATSKLIGERILQEFAISASMNVISFRLFNHTHKSQAPIFFLPGVYRQIAEAEGHTAVLKVGNVDQSRDLSAVEDFSNAITAALQWSAGKGGELGFEVFNLCSGSPKSLRKVIEALSKALGKKVDMLIDSKFIREDESSIVFGDNSKFCHATGWCSLSQSEEQLIHGFLKDLDELQPVQR